MLHEAATRDSIEERLRKLTPESPRQWGKMTIDQMLWHVNTSMELCLGKKPYTPEKMRMPRALLRFAVLNLPWPKGSPTSPDAIPKAPTYDFEAEKEKALRLIAELSTKDLGSAWPEQPVMGRMTGAQWSRLQAKHLDHHLRQFGA
jgi:hypothetical protein